MVSGIQWVWSLQLLVAIATTGVLSQSICPLEWQSYGDSCYQFVFDQTKSYQDAATACWNQGSALVSVNTYSENRFIVGFLNNHARESVTEWYTSGQYISGDVKWYGDGTYRNRTTTSSSGSLDSGVVNDVNPWYEGFTPKLTEDRVIYKYSAMTRVFKWSTVTGLDPLHYICEIPRREVFRIVQQNRDFDYGTNVSQKSEMEQGPQFFVVSPNMVVVGKDWPAILECEAGGKPQPAFSWFEDASSYGTQSFSGPITQVTSTKRYTLTGGRLTITKPNETEDGGVYQCKAENKFGSILSAPIRLSFGVLDQFSPVAPADVTAKRAKGISIKCLAPSAKPALVYNWYRDDAMNFVRPELNKYLFLSTNGNLYFSEVQDNDGGNYYCMVTLVAGYGSKMSNPQPPSRTSKAYHLIVENNTAQEYGPIIHGDFINVYPKPPMVGAEVRMECFAFGRMPLRYSWFRNGRGLPEGTHFAYDNRVLVIPRAKLIDAGNYTCKVEKVAGIQRVEFKSFILTLEAKPYFVVPLKNMHADVDSELTWRCEVEAIPRATYSWYKDSKLLRGIPGDVEIHENVLVIKQLNPARHDGMYQCMATNTHGTSVSTAQLRVLSIKPTFAKYALPTSLVASSGGNLTIRCTPEAAPTPEITWLRNGGAVGGGRAEVYLDGTLHLTQVQTGDQGRYTCKASNLYGEAMSSTQVMVYGGLRFNFKPQNIGNGKVNTTVFLGCAISYDYNSYDLAYVWKFNGRIIDIHHSMFYREGDRDKMGLYIVNAQYRHTGLYECIGQSVSTSISAQAYVTITGPPGEPAGVYAEQSTLRNGSLHLLWTWNPRSNHGHPVTYYNVEAWTEYTKAWELILTDIPEYATHVPDVNNNNDMRRFVKVDNLQPGNSYRFRVRAKNAEGVGPASKPSEIYRIPAAAPRLAPLGVGGGGGSVRTLCMKWQPLRRDQEGGDKFGYIVYWKLADDPQGIPKKKDVGNITRYCVEIAEDMFYTMYAVQVQAYNGMGEGPMSLVMCYIIYTMLQKDVGNITRYCVEIAEDMFYTMYAVQVQAYNGMGEGPMSPVGFAYSAEGMPTVRPSNVKYMPINSTSIWVTWDKVPNTREEAKGRILGYEIDYWKKTTNDTRFFKFYRSFVYCSDCGRALIIGLVPNTRYWVRVEMFTSAGKSTPSEKYLARTYLKAASNFPQYVDVYSHGEHSVTVKWRGVNINVGEDTILGYKLIYWLVGDDIRIANFTTTDSPTTNEAVIYKLQQDSIYNLRVMAMNRGGDGRKSRTVFFTILKGGTVNINPGNFDPANSQVLIAGSPSQHTGWFHVSLLVIIAVIVSFK